MPGISQGENQDISQLCPYLEVLQGKIHFKAPLSCWRNSCSFGRRTEGPIVLLDTVQGPLLAPRGHTQILAMCPSHLSIGEYPSY